MPSETRPVTTHDLVAMKKQGKKIVMLTAYDALLASLLDECGIDIILVGDSVNTVLCGQETTLSATLEQMIYHGRITRAGVKRAFVALDMPFMSYQVSIEDAKRNVGRAMQVTGVQGVKVEGGAAIAPTVRAVVDMGVPVMGHLGLTPQSVHALGGYRVQGRTPDVAERLVTDAVALEEAGVFGIVLELIPTDVARRVTEAVHIPTIGIGSGPHCDGQVLVTHDMLGLNDRFKAKFVKRYAELADEIRKAVRTFAEESRSGVYPDAAHRFDS